MIKVVVCGASGRMGQTIGRMVNESSDLELVGGINLKQSSFFGIDIIETKNAESLLQKTKPDVLIDFTIAHAAVENVKMAARNKVASCRYYRVYQGTAGRDGKSNSRQCPGGNLQ